jgi:hypothetical protein
MQSNSNAAAICDNVDGNSLKYAGDQRRVCEKAVLKVETVDVIINRPCLV